MDKVSSLIEGNSCRENVADCDNRLTDNEKIREEKDSESSVKKEEKTRRHYELGYASLKSSGFLYPAYGFVFIVFLSIFFRPLLVTTFFVIATFVSLMHQKYHRLQIGVEVGIFGTVVCSAIYGWFYGALIGIIAYPLSMYYADEKIEYVPVILIGVVVAAVVAGFVGVGAGNIVMWGLAITLLYDVVTGGLYFYFHRAPVLGSIMFSITHLWFNYFLFSTFGGVVFSILA